MLKPSAFLIYSKWRHERRSTGGESATHKGCNTTTIRRFDVIATICARHHMPVSVAGV
jgi:hypothetical protein